MKPSHHKNHWHHIERTIAVIETSVNRFVCISEAPRVSQPWRETHITIGRAQELTA